MSSAEWSGNTQDQRHDIGEDSCGNSTIDVSKPSEEDHARDGSTEEERLRESWYPGLVTDPVLLHSD